MGCASGRGSSRRKGAFWNKPRKAEKGGKTGKGKADYLPTHHLLPVYRPPLPLSGPTTLYSEIVGQRVGSGRERVGGGGASILLGCWIWFIRGEKSFTCLPHRLFSKWKLYFTLEKKMVKVPTVMNGALCYLPGRQDRLCGSCLCTSKGVRGLGDRCGLNCMEILEDR